MLTTHKNPKTFKKSIPLFLIIKKLNKLCKDIASMILRKMYIFLVKLPIYKDKPEAMPIMALETT